MAGRPPKANPIHGYTGYKPAVLLPADGRQGDPPEFPLRDATPREVELWAQLWITPMAVASEPLRWPYSLAWLIRLLVRLEETEKPRAWMYEAIRAIEDRWGLSPLSQLRLRWSIGEVAGPATVTPITESTRRERLAWAQQRLRDEVMAEAGEDEGANLRTSEDSAAAEPET